MNGQLEQLERLNRRKIAVLCGGRSRERDISLRSGENVYRAIKRLGLEPVKIDVAEDCPAQLINAGVDLAYIALHGKYGEDGCIQGMLESMGIPYTGSGVLASAIGMNKVTTKRILLAEQIATPAFLLIRRGEERESCRQAEEAIGFPLVVKPVEEGSSISISIVRDRASLLAKVREVLQLYRSVFVEKYVAGVEVTTGILEEEGRPVALPVLELVPVNEFYDYDAKYTAGKTEFILPANLDEKIYRDVQDLAVRVHNTVGCRGLSRVDAIVDGDNRIWTIEINTLPGMTETSDLPAQAAEAGIGFDDLVKKILLSGLPADMKDEEN